MKVTVLFLQNSIVFMRRREEISLQNMTQGNIVDSCDKCVHINVGFVFNRHCWNHFPLLLGNKYYPSEYLWVLTVIA